MNMNFFKAIGATFGNAASPQGVIDADGNMQAYTSNTSNALLTNANATQNGSGFSVRNNLYHTVQVSSSNASAAGNTIAIQASQDSSNWTTLGSTVISSATSQLSTFTGKYGWIRAAVTAYNNGSHSVKVVSGN